MRKLAKSVKNNFLRTLQITQMLTRTWQAFLQEQLNISNNFVAFYLPSPALHLWQHGWTAMLQFPNMGRSHLGWKSAAWQPPEESWSSFNTTFPKNCPYVTGVVLPWKTHLKICLLYLIWLKTHSEEKTSPPNSFLLRMFFSSSYRKLFNFVAVWSGGQQLEQMRD